MVARANGDAACRDDEVGICKRGCKGRAGGVGQIGNVVDAYDFAAGRGERGADQHRVGLVDLTAFEGRSWWHELVAGCQDDDAGSSNAGHARQAESGNGRRGEWAQPGAGVEDDVSRLHIGTDVSHEVAARNWCGGGHQIVDNLDAFDRHDRVGASG